MKTAVSIPDETFKSAEKLALVLGKSRSQLYTQALHTYLERHNNKLVTEELNRIYAEINSDLDPTLQNIQTTSLPQEKW